MQQVSPDTVLDDEFKEFVIPYRVCVKLRTVRVMQRTLKDEVEADCKWPNQVPDWLGAP